MQSQAFDTGRNDEHVMAMIDTLKKIDTSKIVCIHSAGRWENKVTQDLVEQLHECGCKFIFEICQLILNDEKAKMNDFGQPFACIGGGKIGFGYGDQDVVLVNQDAFGNQCANSTRVYDLTGKNKNINEIGTILNGEINVDEQATIRIVDMLIQQPQKKEEDENDS